MATLEGFIDEVIVLLKTTSIAQFVPDDPVDSPSDWPFLPVYANSFNVIAEFGSQARYLHNVTIGYLAPALDIDLKNQVLLPDLENVVEAVMKPLTEAGTVYTNCDTFSSIDAIYGPVDWGGVPMFGFLMTINGVKIYRTIT